MSQFSKTQIDKLGERLKAGPPSETDQQMLDEYRRSFEKANEMVVQKIGEQLRRRPSVRSGKSTSSIREKLNRETIRLSQMQNIVGCRILVTSVGVQEHVVGVLREMFPGASVVDRRAKPSFGYRAVHVVAMVCGKPVEIQVRTYWQDMWAELSEKLSDVVDPAIKYGGGPDEESTSLKALSKEVQDCENEDLRIMALGPEDAERCIGALIKRRLLVEKSFKAMFSKIGKPGFKI